jgi:hypothetical protein
MSDSRSTWVEKDGARTELGTFVHEGREFTSLGAMVTATHAAGYPKIPERSVTGTLLGWDGTILGSCRITASWKVESFIGSRMYQIEATIDGRTYTGRGFGSGMLWRGKVKRGSK